MDMETTQADPVASAFQEQADKTSSFLTAAGDKFVKAIPSLITAAIILVLGLLLVKLVSLVVSKTMRRSNVNEAARSFLVSFIRIVLYLVLAAIVLSLLKVPMSSIVTIFGAVGLAISLALQNCLSNLAGGFIILFSKPFSAGDLVEVDGTVGTVRSISILYTQLQTFDSKTVFIPNGKVSDAKIINYTDTPSRRIELTFDISYDSDYSVARALILTYISENSRIMKSPEPIVRMSAHKSSSVAIDVFVWVRNEDYLDIRYSLIEAIKETFDSHGIRIPYDQLDVHIKDRKES
ncbi:MAG: mechanosensitive ion channel family protein [Ruminococcus sp.]|nr:mechanosensitive ion channel family protein [Ruminococcus sp.]